ncbi:M24 family metallopeptidase [Aminiphilus circumscriptus]|uniref:M24 family metallopeptidase n=1 Tax=Aminiphilus circumscriptus TaxID=290732 RepID=UPI000A076063|nr:Xaa-Pro peptidase family protein [Aminiphilus circumscriptus]
MMSSMQPLVQGKIDQAMALLGETGIDCWCTFVRETSEMCDPAMRYLVGADVVGEAAFLLARDGRAFAVLAALDKSDVEALETYRIFPYVQSIREPLREALTLLDPKTIGLNFSEANYAVDGLSFGMYRRLRSLLEGTPYAERLVSAEGLFSKVRSIKTPEELRRIRAAIAETLELFDLWPRNFQEGWTLRRISDFLHEEMHRRNLEGSWSLSGDPGITSGPDMIPGHGTPPDLPVLPGHVLNMDFGIRKDGYSSDLQRVWYRPSREAPEPPGDVRRAFSVVRRGIEEAAAFLRPGVRGCEVDAVARRIVTEAGYPEYAHSLGHQVGAFAHDGGALLGPRWERYGKLVELPVEEGQVFTLEFGVQTSCGYLGQEDMVVVTSNGCAFLTPPQEDLWTLTPGEA